MASGSGRFPSFEPNSDKSWKIYLQRFKCFCVTRKIKEDAEQKAELIACSDDVMFEYMQALVDKDLCDEALKFKDIVDAIEKLVQDPDNEIEASAIFHSRSQQPGESVKDFVAELRRLARPCKFEDALERTLRDRIVIGIASLETRALLFRLPKEKQTVDGVIEVARSVESAQRQALATSGGPPAAVHLMGRSAPAPSQRAREHGKGES